MFPPNDQKPAKERGGGKVGTPNKWRKRERRNDGKKRSGRRKSRHEWGAERVRVKAGYGQAWQPNKEKINDHPDLGR